MHGGCSRVWNCACACTGSLIDGGGVIKRNNARRYSAGGCLHKIFGGLVLLLAACAQIPSSPARYLEVLTDAGFVPALAPPVVKSFLRQAGDAPAVNIYIEGDGAAWFLRTLPPGDPTPRQPVAARLALADRAAIVGYVGRPCQFMEPVRLRECSPSLWTDARFGDSAIALTDAAIDGLLSGLPHGRQVNLVGFSGGGTLALLVAAGRTDVACVVTLASPLDIDAWSDLNGVARLAGSRNPASPSTGLSRLRQTHIYGAADRIVPVSAVGHYRNFSGDSQVKVFAGNRGHGDWEKFWPSIRDSTCLNPSTSNAARAVPADRIVAEGRHTVTQSEVLHG